MIKIVRDLQDGCSPQTIVVALGQRFTDGNGYVTVDLVDALPARVAIASTSSSSTGSAIVVFALPDGRAVHVTVELSGSVHCRMEVP